MDERGAVRFNPNHAPAGSATGGQFAAASGSSAAARPTPTNQHPVGQGETGKRVSDLQARLNALGFKPPLKVDGIFGPKTLAAVKAFQVSRGLKADGLVGPKTTAALRGGKSGQHTPAHTTTPHAPAKAESVHTATAGRKLSGKPGSITSAQKDTIRQLVKDRQVPGPDARDATSPAEMNALAEAEAQALIKHLQSFPPRKAAPVAKTAARAGGQVANPGGTAKLHEYWVHGEGAAKIRWGSPGDFDRCVLHLGKFIADPKGYCAQAHHDALGIWPATHAAEIKAGRADMATTAKAPYGTSVAYADPGYLDADGNQASKSGKPGVKRYLLSADKVMAAWSYINQAKNAGQYTSEQLSAIKGRIRSAMAKHGHDVMDKPAVSRAEAVFSRIWELEDIRIVSRAQGDGSGRLVEAYAAVFNVPAEIYDQHGHYDEVNDPGAFNRSIDHAARSSRSPFRCIYNHGMTLQGTPSDRGSIPIGTPEEVRAETRGLLTRTRYNETSLADDVLEAIRSGGITAQSYTGRILRSDPELRRGEKYRPGRDGKLITVRRLELALREYGPTPFPAFSGAEILGVRMSTPGAFGDPDPDEIEDEALPPDEEPAAGDPLPEEEEHSARYHQHALYVLRAKEAREKVGLAW